MKRLLRDLLRSGVVQRALGVLAAEYLRLVWYTNRFSYQPHDVYGIVEPLMPAIFVFWHGQHFMTPFIKTKDSYRAKVLISQCQAPPSSISITRRPRRSIRAWQRS